MKLWGYTKSDAVGIAFVLAITMAAGWFINCERGRRLPLRYQTAAERMEAVVREIGTEHDGRRPVSDHVNSDTEITLVDFKAIVRFSKSWVVDARPAVFHRLGHVPGALSLPRNNFASAYEAIKTELEKNRHRPIVVYCSGEACADSELVCGALQKLGYTNLAIFRGGWSEWTAAGLPEEKGRS